mmetsp:Transcript_19536/g.39565  ORF Transcript_19536/g.39565 Transcript_19536/m.39565 type:complete len:276 (+) Transcript_19536:426-1253(+)
MSRALPSVSRSSSIVKSRITSTSPSLCPTNSLVLIFGFISTFNSTSSSVTVSPSTSIFPSARNFWIWSMLSAHRALWQALCFLPSLFPSFLRSGMTLKCAYFFRSVLSSISFTLIWSLMYVWRSLAASRNFWSEWTMSILRSGVRPEMFPEEFVRTTRPLSTTDTSAEMQKSAILASPSLSKLFSSGIMRKCTLSSASAPLATLSLPYMYSTRKGVKGAMRQHIVLSTWKRAWRLQRASSRLPSVPFIRSRLYLTYLLVRSSMNRMSSGMTVYRW